MRKLMPVLSLFGLVLFAAAPVPAIVGGLCCACLEANDSAQTSGATTNQSALFCVGIPTVELANQTQRCENLWGGIECTPYQGVPCTAELAEQGIACPASGAPTAGPWALTGIVVALAGLGMLAARRRA